MPHHGGGSGNQPDHRRARHCLLHNFGFNRATGSPRTAQRAGAVPDAEPDDGAAHGTGVGRSRRHHPRRWQFRGYGGQIQAHGAAVWPGQGRRPAGADRRRALLHTRNHQRRPRRTADRGRAEELLRQQAHPRQFRRQRCMTGEQVARKAIGHGRLHIIGTVIDEDRLARAKAEATKRELVDGGIRLGQLTSPRACRTKTKPRWTSHPMGRCPSQLRFTNSMVWCAARRLCSARQMPALR